jgi:hypothetical protein
VRRLSRPIPLIGTGLGVLLGLAVSTDPVGAVLGALVGVGAGVVIDRRREAPRPARIDPFTLGEPWRRAVQDALKARGRFQEAIGRASEGPVRERLVTMGERVGESVEACWRIAGHGQAMADARRHIDVRQLEVEAASLRENESTGTHHGPTAAALEGQLAAAHRLDGVVQDTRDRLRLLNARLDEAVARSIELATRRDQSALDPVGSDVEDVADELEALRLALDETDGLSGPG